MQGDKWGEKPLAGVAPRAGAGPCGLAWECRGGARGEPGWPLAGLRRWRLGWPAWVMKALTLRAGEVPDTPAIRTSELNPGESPCPHPLSPEPKHHERRKLWIGGGHAYRPEAPSL